MHKFPWKKICKEAIKESLDLLSFGWLIPYKPMWKYRENPEGSLPTVSESPLEDVRIVVTRVADSLDCIDEFDLDNELRRFHLEEYPTEVVLQDKEKEFVRPHWAIEVFHNGQLVRQITYYLQSKCLDREIADVEDIEVPNPLHNGQ